MRRFAGSLVSPNHCVYCERMVADITCPVCRSSDHRIIGHGDNARFIGCRACTMEWAAETDKPQDSSSPTETAFVHSLLGGYERRLESARLMLPNRLACYEASLGYRPKRVLEIGCADGVWHEAYAEHDIEWTGVEIDESLAATAQARGNPVTRIDFLDLDEVRRYDVLFASQVLEHIDDPHRFLSKASRLLSDEGILHIDVPNQDALQARVLRALPSRNRIGFLELPHHRRAYRKKALGTLLERNRFDVVRLDTCSSNDLTFGQLEMRDDLPSRLFYSMTDAVGGGNLLVALARRS